MRTLLTLAWLALTCSTTVLTLRTRNHNTHDYFALHLSPSSAPEAIAAALSLDYEGPLGELADHHTFSSPRHRRHDAEEVLQELRRRRRKRSVGTDADVLDGVLWSQKQVLKPPKQKRGVMPPLRSRQSTADSQSDAGMPPAVEAAMAFGEKIAHSLEIKDPIFKDQWHLYNPIQPGNDLNVTGIWLQGITGHNATVALVDDGIDMYSDDLKGNYFAEGSYDFNDHTDEPKPRLSDDKHGTRCAGEVAAAKNDVCGVGVAWDAKVAGIRILSAPVSDEDEALALNYGYQKNDIYSCSWGPPDDGQSMDAPGLLIRKAMVNAVQNGRGGKGSIFVFASGNGAASEDNCNFDGYTNSIYSITVGAIDRKGMHPYYSEKCSAQLVVTCSSGSGDAIHTTDVGTNQCSTSHGGTSAAAPLGAGVFALVLSVRPDLSWRDLQYLCVNTAIPINDDDGDWQITKIGKKYSHTYGYGKLDAYAIVEAAKTFESVKPQAWHYSPWVHVNHDIPQGDLGLVSEYEVTDGALKNSNLERLEHVTVTMNVRHAKRGDLSVELRSPDGIVSHLSATRKHDTSASGYEDWTFMSVVHWGESGNGKWTVVVKDTQVNEFNGTFIDWKLNLWGECIDASKQDLLPMPTEHDDDDHDVTTTALVATTSLSLGSPSTNVSSAEPTDHPDRPVNEKPTATPSATTTATTTTTTTTATTATTTTTATTSATPTATSNPDHFLPSFFPTFGVSKRTQIWIYGAVVLIVIFCSGLGIYFLVQRKKRLRNSRDDYEFEMLDENDFGGGPDGAPNGKKPKRRAGELYDAFAGESDEEMFSDAEEYKDEDDLAGDIDKEERGRRPSRDDREKLLGR